MTENSVATTEEGKRSYKLNSNELKVNVLSRTDRTALQQYHQLLQRAAAESAVGTRLDLQHQAILEGPEHIANLKEVTVGEMISTHRGAKDDVAHLGALP